MGLPIFIAVRTTSISDLKSFIGGYHEGWREAGHPGRGEIALIVPVYVADTERRAREEAEASTMHFFRTIAEALGKGGTRREEAAKLGRMSYDEILKELVVYGTPESVTAAPPRAARGSRLLDAVRLDERRRAHPPRAHARLDAALRRARDPAVALRRRPCRS